MPCAGGVLRIRCVGGAVVRLRRTISSTILSFFHIDYFRYTLPKVAAEMTGNSPQISGTFSAYAISGREKASLVALPLREPDRDEIRVKVAYVGICGSDLHYYFEGANGSFVIREPLIPGHEVSGTIDLDPQGVHKIGAAVAIHPAQSGAASKGLEGRPHLWHGVRYLGSAATSPHTQGALAQYIYVKRDMVRPLPEGVSLKLGALAEPLAVALHGVALAGALEGKSVLISGAGPIGLLAIVGARSAGAARITTTDIFDEPLARARSVGADEILNVKKSSLPTDSFDVVLECSGSLPAVNSAISAVARGGTIVQVGMISRTSEGVDLGRIVTKELRFLGSFRFNDEMTLALALLQRYPELENCISHQFALSDAQQGFEMAKSAQLSGKVMISC